MAQRFELELHPRESEQLQSGYEVGRFLGVLYRQKRKAIVFFVAVMAAVTLLIIFSERVYRAEGMLFVRLGRENSTLDPTAMLGQPTTVIPSVARDNEINSLAELLRGQGLAEKVVDEVGPNAILNVEANASPGLAGRLRGWLEQVGALTQLAHRDRAIVRFEKNLKVEAVPKSNVIQIMYDSPQRETSQKVVNTLIDFYLKQHGELNGPRGAHQFLAEQMERLRSSLTRAEEEFRDKKNEAGIVSLRGRSDSLVEERSQLQSGLDDAIAEVAASEAEVRGLAAQLTSLPKTQIVSEMTGVGDYGTDLMRGQLYSLRLREKELAARYTDAYPELQVRRAEAEAGEKALDREERTRSQVTTAPNRAYDETQVALSQQQPVLESLKAKVEAYRKQLTEVEQNARSFNADELALRSLEREMEIQDSKYRKYSESLEQERINEALEAQRISNVNVAQPATCQPKPVTPKPLLYFLAGLGFAVCGGIGVAFAADFTDRSLKTAEELEAKLGLPNLASIPHFKSQRGAPTARN